MADSKLSALSAVASVTGTQEFYVNDAAASKKATATQIQTFVLASYAGASSITTLGTVGTGVWQGTIVSPTYGGTGVNNASRTLTINTNSGTIAFAAASKTLTISKSLTLDGTDGTTLTFPATSATIARTDAAQTFTGTQTFSSTIAGSINGNAATVTTNANLTGHVTSSGNTTTIPAGTVTLAMMANIASGSLIYRKTASAGVPEVQTLATLKTDLGLTGTNSGDQTITLTGNVTGSGTGSFATTIANNVVTLGMMAQMATASFLGRNTASTGNVEVLSAATAKTMLGLVKGDVGLGNVENTALSTWAGTSNITTLGTIGTGTWNATVISLAKGGTGVALSDPNADRIMFWDDSAGVVDWLTLGTNLSITGTTLNASGGGITNGAGNNVIPKSDGTNLVASVLTESSGHILLGASARLASSYQTGYISFHDDTTQNAIRFAPQGAEGSYWKTYETGTGTNTKLYLQFLPRATGATYNGTTVLDSYASNMSLAVTSTEIVRIVGAGYVGIGHSAFNTISSPLDVLSTTAQLKLRYDVNNYLSITVAGTGGTTFDIASDNGTPGFTFSKQIRSTLTGSGAPGLDFATSDTYLLARVITNTTGSSDKHLYLNYNAGATSNVILYSNNTEVFKVSGGNLATVTGGLTVTGDITTTSGTITAGNFSAPTGALEVANHVYGSDWNGNFTVPTKDAVYDKIETLPTLTSTSTFTNKRITPRVGTVASSATPTINTDDVDMYRITGLTTDITSMTTNLSGTPTDGQRLWISITGTAARTITWGTSFEASTVALPTTTVTTDRLDVGFVWNTVTSKWRCVAVA